MPLTNHFPEIIEELPGRIERAVDDTLEEVAKSAAGFSRFDETATDEEHLHMKDAWRWKMTSKYGTFSGVVINLKEYAIYNEFGTRFMSAAPMVRPAMMIAREPFQERVVGAFKV